MKKLLIGLTMLLGLAAAAPATAQPQLRAYGASVGSRGVGSYVYNNWYYCPAGSAPVYLNGGTNLVTRYVYPYGYVQSYVYAPYPGVYCVY